MILDGAMGTELEARGVDTSGDEWTARAVIEQPDVVRDIHLAYADAGAHVITTCTFRTTRRGLAGSRAGEPPAPPWAEVAATAVRLARDAGVKVAGSIAPLADCWHPERSPAVDDPKGARREHAALANVLADAGCDILLCETFPHVGEGLIALEAAAATGVESWLSLTPGYRGDLQAADVIGQGARRAVDAGAAAVLVNCAPVGHTERIIDALCSAVDGRVPVGAAANGRDEHGRSIAPNTYADHARRWIAAGASIVGGCCYTTPAHIRELVALSR